MPGRPAHYNQIRLIGRLEGIHKTQKLPIAFLVSIDVDGDATKIVAWPRRPAPLDLMVGDLVEVTGCLKYDTTGGRKALHYIDAGRIELVRRGTSPIGAEGNGVGAAGPYT
jgi:hypothetical protein